MYISEAFGHSKKHQPSPDPAVPLRYHPISPFPYTPQIVQKQVCTCAHCLTTRSHIGLYNPYSLLPYRAAKIVLWELPLHCITKSKAAQQSLTFLTSLE